MQKRKKGVKLLQPDNILGLHIFVFPHLLLTSGF